jgi:hypothetical protein
MAGKKKGDLEHDNSSNTPLTDDELHSLTLHHKKQYESALATKKKAASSFLEVTKKIKAELGSAGLLDIKDMLASETEDDFEEKIQGELERKARLARWLGLDVGTQIDLFGDATGVKPPLADRAYEDGKRSGLAGEVCKPPFDAGGEAHQKYVEGWHFGQAALASQIKKKDAGEIPLIVKADREESTVDEFDAAATGDDDGDDDSAPWPDDAAIENRTVADVIADGAEREQAEAL